MDSNIAEVVRLQVGELLDERVEVGVEKGLGDGEMLLQGFGMVSRTERHAQTFPKIVKDARQNLGLRGAWERRKRGKIW